MSLPRSTTIGRQPAGERVLTAKEKPNPRLWQKKKPVGPRSINCAPCCALLVPPTCHQADTQLNAIIPTLKKHILNFFFPFLILLNTSRSSLNSARQQFLISLYRSNPIIDHSLLSSFHPLRFNQLTLSTGSQTSTWHLTQEKGNKGREHIRTRGRETTLANTPSAAIMLPSVSGYSSPSCLNSTRPSVRSCWSSPHCLMTMASRVVRSAACRRTLALLLFRRQRMVVMIWVRYGLTRIPRALTTVPKPSNMTWSSVVCSWNE